MAKKSKRDDFIADSDEDLEQGSGSEEAAFTDGGSDDEDRKPKVTKSKKDSKAKGKPDSQDVKPKQESKQPAAKVCTCFYRASHPRGLLLTRIIMSITIAEAQGERRR